MDFTQLRFHDQHSTTRFGASRKHSLSRLSEIAERCGLCHHILDTFNSRIGRSTCEQIQQNWDMDQSSAYISINDFSNIAIQSRLCYFSVHITFAITGSQTSNTAVKFYFQKGSSEPVEEVCERFPNFEWQVEHGVARWRPLVVDFRLFWKWNLFATVSMNINCVFLLLVARTFRRIRLIDVHLKSLVERSPDGPSGEWNISWVTLNYVWGSTNFNCLQVDTLNKFQTREFFCPGSVPQTILDAIRVTEGLGERYLWVDSCCMIQDSDDDKKEFVSQMDIIYGLASLTIVNAAGNHADHGLPGVRPVTRHNVQSHSV